MLNQHLSLVVCLYIASVGAAFGQSSYIFQLPGPTGLTPQLVGLGDNDFHRVAGPAIGPAGATKVLATPNGAKFYILAPGGVFSANSTFTSFAPVSAIAGVATAAEVSPDGKYLLVMTDHFYIIDTATNSLAAGIDTGVPTGSTPIGVAVSHDGNTAWVLSNTTTGSAMVAVNLTTREVAGLVNLPFTASSITLSARNLLYINTTNRIYEIEPTALAITVNGQIEVPNGIPGPLQFTPDGNNAYFLNQQSCSTCPPLFKLSVPSHAVSGWLPTDGTAPPPIRQILVAGNNRIFALLPATTLDCISCLKLSDITPTPLTLSTSASTIPFVATSNVLAAAVSDERPSARYLYLLISDHNFFRVSLANNGIEAASSLDPANGTILSFVPIPATSGATTVFPVNPIQNVTPGGTTVLVAQFLDSVGRPVTGLSASFSSDPADGITIATPSVITTAGGWAQTAVTGPTAGGNYNVTLSGGASLSQNFQLVVGGASPGGNSLISLYIGDGQLLRQNQSTLDVSSGKQPLTVRVTDAEGNPQANVAVAFQLTEGLGSVFPAEVFTDASGLAGANFTAGVLFSSTPYLLSKVTALSDYGSVEFYVVTHRALANDPHQPDSDIVTPSDKKITIPQGGFIPSAITAYTIAEGQPIPNVGLRISDADNFNLPSKLLSCVGLTRGDNNGISRCDVRALCQPNIFIPPAGYVRTQYIQVGEYRTYPLEVTLTNGTPSQLSIVSGNNQAGNPGNSFNIFARVTDGCSQPAPNFGGLVWSVIQGSATLSNEQTTSDAGGNVSARVNLGQTAGPVRVQLSGPGLTTVIFNLTVQISVSGITLVSGNGQSVPVGQSFPNPVVFVVRDSINNPVPNFLVSFSVTTGSATVTPTSGTTNAQGQVQTNVTAGSASGAIVVTASAGTFSATATLTSVLAGPTVVSSSFKNAASFADGLTPCGLATVTGVGLAPLVQGVVSGVSAFGPLPYALAGVTITVNGILAPIQAVANQNNVQQVNFQAPCNLTAGNATVVVTVNGASTTVANVPVLAVQPGIFAWAGPGNKLYGAVIRAADGTYVTPTNQARRGDRLYMVVTGLGQVTPTALTGAVGTGSQNVNLPIVVGVADKGVGVLSARYLIGAVGAYLIEFQIPEDAPVGPDQSLALAALTNNGTTFVFGNPVFLPGVMP